jgi:glycosyltransferase involved in cell wall biosynthesis
MTAATGFEERERVIAKQATETVRAPRILSLSCLFPTSLDPNQGLFVERRLQHLAEMAEVKVISPFAVVHYGNTNGRKIRLAGLPCRQQENLSVLHPRWFYPPLGGISTGFWLFLQLLPVVARLRAEFPFEIIDTHFGHPEGIAGALLSRALRVPFTMTLRGNEPKHSRSRLGRFWIAWALRRASKVFVLSERLRQFAIGLGADPARVTIVPNGIDAAVFFPRDRAACRLKHGFAADRPLLLSAGALVERKGHHRILRALAAMAPDRRPQLAIVGGPGPEGSYAEQLVRLAATLDLGKWVRFLGPVSPTAMAELMSAADVFCLASTNEGWPNVIHEALACGTPVVATDVGAVPEMLAGGRYGCVAPVNNPAALEKALAEALERDWDRTAIAAWGCARSWRQVAAEVWEEMKIIAANQPIEVSRCMVVLL